MPVHQKEHVLGPPLLLASTNSAPKGKWGSSVLPGEKELEGERAQLSSFSVQGSWKLVESSFGRSGSKLVLEGREGFQQES